MPDKRIAQFPIGVLTPSSLLPIVVNDTTSQINFNQVLDLAHLFDIHLTGGTYNPNLGITTITLSNGASFDVTGYFELGYIPEDIANKQNSMDYDGTGIKYPTVDAVNSLTNNISLAILNTGFIDSTDTFSMYKIDDFTLGVSATSKGILFKSLLETTPFGPLAAILQIPDAVIPLNAITFTGDGSYIRFIGFDDIGQFVYSEGNFRNYNNIAQLGVLILKVSGGTVSFIDATRDIINMPSICGYSNLETTVLGLQSNVTVRPNSGTLTVNNTNGSIKGMSVNWHGPKNDELPIPSSSATSFTHLSYANALTPTPPPFVSAVTTGQYWSGSSLVNISSPLAATIQRWIVTVNGTIALQYGEQEYPDLITATNNISTATFIDIIPKDTYAEIARMAAISGATDLSDVAQAIFVVTAGASNVGATNSLFWGDITGTLSAQTDLFTTFQVPTTYPFINLGTATTATTSINLATNRNYNINITGDTGFNFTSGPDGTENNLVINMPLPVRPTITFPSNVIWHNNSILPINNIDGIRDISFVGSVGTQLITTVVQQPDNKIIIGGNFTQVNGVTQNYLARLNLDGTSDTDFNFYFGTDLNNSVNSIALQSDNKILVSGAFRQHYGLPVNSIIRLNTNGAPDYTFNIGTSGFNVNTGILSINIQTGDSKIICGGTFTTFSGITQNRIIRLNSGGTVDTSFSAGTGFNGQINKITIQSDDKILCGGFQTFYNEIPSNNITRLNTNGSIDLTFTGNANNSVLAIKQQSDGKLLVGGTFTATNPMIANSLIKLNEDGSKDTSYNTDIGFNDIAHVGKQQLDGKLVVAGAFTAYSGQPITHIARLNTDGTLDPSFNIGGTGFNVTTTGSFNLGLILAIQTGDSKMLVGGAFTQYNGLTQNRIVRLNSDGTVDNLFNIGTGFNDTVRSIEVQSNGKILVGGIFTQYSGVTNNNVIRLNTDGTIDTSFNVGPLNGLFLTLLPQSDGKVLLGGGFQINSAITQNYITRVNSDGTKDITFSGNAGFNTNGRVNTIFIQPDNKIIAGGLYTYSGVGAGTAGGIARLNQDGSIDNSFVIGAGINLVVYPFAITQQLDGKIIFGTSSTNTYQGVPIKGIVRINTNASIDTSFNSGNTTGFGGGTTQYQPLVLSGDSKIFVVGGFNTYNGTPQNRMTRFNSDGSLDTDFNIGTGFNNTVRTIEIQSPHNRILVGGEFTSFNGVSVNGLIRIFPNGNIDTSFVPSVTTAVYSIVQQPDGKLLVGGSFTNFNRITRLTASTENNIILKIKQEDSNIFIK